MREKPYLSVVATSRNDGHGGNILKRMQLFVRGLIDQANRHRLPIELIIVEWNPPVDRPLLQEVLPKPAKDDQLELRYIVVPSSIHNRYHHSPGIPLFQMTAKNVGIRRAKGKFILCTNIDLLFSDPLFRLLAARNLREDTYYRANRCDVTDGIDPAWDIATQLEWCSRHLIRRLGRDMRFRYGNLEQYGFSEKSWIKKWLFDKIAFGMKYVMSPEKYQYYQIDSYACGDFTLMANSMWLDMRGYIEVDLYSIHVDTMGLIAVTALGYKQHVFPREACTYHIDHAFGWSSMNPLEKIRYLEQRPGMDYGLVFEAGLSILKEKSRLDVNRDDWGFADHSFQEYCFPE